MRMALRRCWIAVALLSAAGAVLTTVFHYASHSTSRQQRTQDMGYILYAISGHLLVEGTCLPPTCRDALGRPMCSWRLALHPYVQSAFYPVDRYDVHWFAPAIRFATGEKRQYDSDCFVDP